jgi:hypothetical protein
MGVVDAWFRGRSQAVSGTARVAAALREDPSGGLDRLAEFARGLDPGGEAGDALLTRLDSLRPAWRVAVSQVLRGLRDRPIPLTFEEAARFRRVSAALSAVRDAAKRIHVDLCEVHGPSSPRALLAVARALDAQSRLLDGAIGLRIALPGDAWDELCRLAHPLWVAAALDEPAFGDIATPGESDGETAGGQFALPLLLRLTEPLGLSDREFDVARAIARATARRTSVRIDLDGLPHVCPDGPSLMLSTHHTVQLDARALNAAIRRARRRLMLGETPAALGLRTPLSGGTVDALLGRLETVWAPKHVPSPLVRPPLADALMLVGLPVGGASPTSPGGAGTVPASSASPYRYQGAPGSRTGAESGFETGFGEMLESVQQARESAVAALMSASANRVTWRGQDARRAVFRRVASQPRLRIGQVVAVLPCPAGERASHAARPGSGPTRLLVGRIVTLADTGASDAAAAGGHDIGVEFWPGSPEPVRVTLESGAALGSAWWYPVAGGDGQPFLVVRRDSFPAAGTVRIRGAVIDRVVRLRQVIDSAVDHDRIAVSPV